MQKNTYMHTQMRQVDINKKIIDHASDIILNKNQVKEGSLLIVYTKVDISSLLKNFLNSDKEMVFIDAGDAFFSVIYLDHESSRAHDLIKNFQHYWLQDTKSIYHFDDLPKNQHHLFNFINNFLFEIEEKKYYIER